MSVISDDIAQTHDQIITALIGVLAVTTTGLVFIVKNHFANRETPSDLKGLVSEVERQRRFWEEQHSDWSALPPELRNAVGLVVRLNEIREDLRRVEEQLREHVRDH